MDRQRLDKWLWHARIVRTRTDAAALVVRGRVRINGKRQASPGHSVKQGDVLTIALDARVRILKVAGFCDRRGDASAAQAIYLDLQSPRNDYLPVIPSTTSLAALHVLRYATPEI